MSVTIGGVTLGSLQAQPFGYETTDTRGGLTARQWEIQGVVTGAEWLALLGVYDTWRNAKILEDPAEKSKVVGTTVAFSGSGYGGQTWSGIACWFTEPPSGTQVGSMVSVQCTLVDAAQAVQVIIKQEADDDLGDDTVDYGTITLGGVTITLTADPDVFLDTPQLELTAAGKHYVTGPQVAIEAKEIEGTIIGTDKTALRNWYAGRVTSSPAAGSYFPISAPTFNGIYKIIAGAPVLYYEVSLTVVLVE